MDITTVADDLIVAHDGLAVHRLVGLSPGTEYSVMGVAVRTLDRPAGELLCRFGTVNDVHFGEVEAGRIDDLSEGPIQHVEPDERPYPLTMNEGAVGEMAAADLTAVVVKGDLSSDGKGAEWAAFEACYRTAFGEGLFAVRGNHDAYHGQQAYAGDQWIELPGIAVALIDTTVPRHTAGALRREQLTWLDDLAATADRPVFVMGHHPQSFSPGRPSDADAQTEAHAEAQTSQRGDDYAGLSTEASDALTEVIERRRRIVAYAAGHTHRHRIRTLPNGVPTIEVGCVKDFPGTWAEYRVYEGGITQVVHRISTADALAWSERCRHLYSDFGVDYESYALGRLEDRCCNISLR